MKERGRVSICLQGSILNLVEGEGETGIDVKVLERWGQNRVWCKGWGTGTQIVRGGGQEGKMTQVW